MYDFSALSLRTIALISLTYEPWREVDLVGV